MHRDVPGRPPPGVRVLRRRAAADQLRQLGDRGDRGAAGPRAEADQRVPAAAEPLPVPAPLLPGAAAQREGARRAAGRVRPAQLPGARAPGRVRWRS